MRKQQARCSVLIELNNKKDIFSATSACEQIGDVRSAYSYNGESQNVFLLIEFSSEESVKELLLKCSCKNLEDAFIPFSRIIRFNKKLEKSTPKTTVSEEEVIVQSVKSKQKTVSELMEHMYVSEKLSELDTRLRFFFCEFLKDALGGLFPYCDALPFGSSVNGFGKQNCDLDVMIRLYPSQVVQNSEFYFFNKTCVGNMLKKRSIYALGTFFSTFLPGFSHVEKILHARVPIVKFKHNITGMECDISVNNMSAILMSEILYFCGEIDSRVRPLLYAVKRWAKEANVTYSTPGSWITNFGLSLLVIFFLQNRPVPILPPLIDALQIIGEETAPDFGVEYLTPITDLQAKASLNTESLAVLLKEFLNFLGSHPFQNKHISVLTGKASTLKECCDALWVQNPIEEHKNVTKNVAHSDRYELCEKAQLSSKFIASNMGVKCGATSDLSLILGIPHLLKTFAKNSKELHMSKLLNEKNQNGHRKKHQRKT
ncbi:Poly(A) RNA polymerase, mitochondrial [Araneus ventricosus]|uniref:Poly(A) RNA polymerase, mitochondrial n=1 Tax=Araneus ventricosus TaxID=182803 RepID=A0A4Y2QMU9_ARAVE|nr:Poly(A) RNA polymerase, mitochondrial [Araneus ventricosus]